MRATSPTCFRLLNLITTPSLLCVLLYLPFLGLLITTFTTLVTLGIAPASTFNSIAQLFRQLIDHFPLTRQTPINILNRSTPHHEVLAASVAASPAAIEKRATGITPVTIKGNGG
jgi:hypothetical protein